jgi:hypothetical protein
MTDIIERAARAIYRAAATSDLADPLEAHRALHAVLVAIETPDREMVAAVDALGLHMGPGEAGAVWLAMAKSLKSRASGPISIRASVEHPPPDRLVPRRQAEG